MDESSSDTATSEDELARVSFAEILGPMANFAPTLAANFDAADQRRGWVAIHLMTSQYGAGALEELITFADGLVWLADRAETPVKELARRIRNDINDGIDGMMQTKEALVLSACRDLMEVTVLARDIRKDKQRLRKWLASDENTRRQDFGFNRELRMYSHESIPYMDNIEAVGIEYTLHSRSLHPAPATESATELSHDTPERLSGAAWVSNFVYEISRHGLSALRQVLEWLLSDFRDTWPDEDDPDQPGGFLPPDGGLLDLFEASHRDSWSVDDDLMNSMIDKYRTRPKTAPLL